MHIKKSFEDICVTVWRLSGQPAGSRISGCSLHFCLWKKRDSLYCVVTVCSALPSRTPETSLEMEKEAATSAWSSPEHQWLSTERTGHRHPLPRVRKWAEPGKARSRCVGGWVYSKGAAAELFIRQPRRAQTGRSPTKRSEFSTSATGQRHVAPYFKNLKLSRIHHGSHLDSVRYEAQKCQCQVQSASYAQGWQLRLIIISGEYFFFVLKSQVK